MSNNFILWRVPGTIGLFLITFSLLLIGCGGGGGGGGGSSSPSSPPPAELSVVPIAGGFNITWHNLADFNPMDDLQRVSINITRQGSSSRLVTINVNQFVAGTYILTGSGLMDGEAYKFNGLVLEYSGDTPRRELRIAWTRGQPTNEEDNDGNGIVVGANHDGDGRADTVDTDKDGDEVLDTGESPDNCPLVANRDQQDTDGDGKGDVCDEDKDGDGILNGEEVAGCELKSNCDNDDLDDSEDACPAGQSDWSNDGTNDFDGDGCRNDEDPDDDNDGILDVDEEAGCELTVDCDNDRVNDIDEARGCVLEEDCDSDGDRDNLDIDDDGDGLIEIATAEQLNAVCWVLDGAGFKATEAAMLDQTGCGDGVDMTVCNGYELVRDISLTDFITKTNATAGWQPIAPDVDTGNTACDGDRFTAIFDGNGFKVSGLFIDRSGEDCIGLFGQANGTIRHLGVIADKVEGRSFVGGLVGDGASASIVQSYAVSGEVRGNDNAVGGLVGLGTSASIVQSYAVSGEVRGSSLVGGLVGIGTSASIVQSYAVSGEVRGNGIIGGLVGLSTSASIVQSYAVSGEVRGSGSIIGGLMGLSTSASIVQSYAVSGEVRGSGIIGALVGAGGSANVSYWDTETSGKNDDQLTGSSGQTTMALRSPTDYTDIYTTWDDGLMVDAINDNATIWCDEDLSGMIEDDERRDNTHANGDNRVWDFGTSTDYPALRCTGDSLADQRAWWHLDATHKPELNQTRLDAYLDGTLP